ncbi:MAG: IS1634 family transposase [Acidimicrobiales bacterium]
MPELDNLQHRTHLLGGLPIVNRFLERLHLEEILRDRLPTPSGSRLGPAPCLGVLLRNLLLSREPLYGLASWAAPYRSDLLGLRPWGATLLNDDRLGRALDTLFDADRASLATEIVVRAIREFHLAMDCFHNDSTTITLQGAYASAMGARKRGRTTLRAAFGHNKDHRPDLKQLLWILTISADGAVPVAYRTEDGNRNDSPTHRESWDTLRGLTGRTDFFYVADSKLCSDNNLRYIDGQGGRFLTVLPRSRKEDRLFRDYVQTHELPWEEVLRRPNPRDQYGPMDVWRMAESPIPAGDGFRLAWVWSSLMADRDRESREGRMAKAILSLEKLETRLRSPKTKLRTRETVARAAEKAVGPTARRWVRWEITEENVEKFRQEHRGRPGKETRYRKTERIRYHVVWQPEGEAILYDARSDGMFPLLSNDRKLSLGELLTRYHFQPRLEKRHEQLKTVYEVAPVWLKKVERIEALLFVYFLTLLVEALIEREVRQGMEREERESLPLYPEGRPCPAPTTDKVLEAFDRVEAHELVREGRTLRRFGPELTEPQRDLLRLAGVPEESYGQ